MGIGAFNFTADAQAPDACTLLSPAEIAQATGERVGEPDRVSTNEGTTCRFSVSSEHIRIAMWPTHEQSFEDLRETLELGGKTETVADVGDAAFFWEERIYARKGRQGVTVYFTGLRDEPDPQRRAAAASVARAAFAKL